MLRDRGYRGSVVQLRRVVAALRPAKQEAFLRLATLPAEHYGEFRVMLRSDGDLMRFEINLRRIWSLCVT
jgi:hypothetical protein